MKQAFKGKTLTLKKTVNNIVKVYNNSDKFSNNDWYKEANDYAGYLANIFDIKISVACGIIAALSPIKTWNENKLIAYSFLQSGKAGHVKLFLEKAKAILECGGEVEDICTILNGRKITSFFLNILNPSNSQNITIDRHALSIALGRNIKEQEGVGITKRQYEFFVTAYKAAGAKLNISPVLVQSVTWQTWRDAKGIKENDVPF